MQIDLEPKPIDLEKFSMAEMDKIIDNQPEEWDRNYMLYKIAIVGKMWESGRETGDQ